MAKKEGSNTQILLSFVGHGKGCSHSNKRIMGAHTHTHTHTHTYIYIYILFTISTVKVDGHFVSHAHQMYLSSCQLPGQTICKCNEYYDFRFGRRPALLAGSVIFNISSIAASFSPNYTAFVIVRFIVGFSTMSIYTTGFVLRKILPF